MKDQQRRVRREWRENDKMLKRQSEKYVKTWYDNHDLNKIWTKSITKIKIRVRIVKIKTWIVRLMTCVKKKKKKAEAKGFTSKPSTSCCLAGKLRGFTTRVFKIRLQNATQTFATRTN